jgi:hypothetical protein
MGSYVVLRDNLAQRLLNWKQAVASLNICYVVLCDSLTQQLSGWKQAVARGKKGPKSN